VASAAHAAWTTTPRHLPPTRRLPAVDGERRLIVVGADDLHRQLGVVRRRRDEAVRLEAELAGRQATLEAKLAALKDDVLGGQQGAAQGLLEDGPGPILSAAELEAAIRAWRSHIPAISSLAQDVRPGRDHVRGDPAAPLVVVEYGDYECAECAEAHRMSAAVEPWLADGRLCIAFRHFPLADAHPAAVRYAQAAEAAAGQGRFWEMHHVLMARVSERRPNGPVEHADRDSLDRAATRAGLDVERFRTDLDDATALQRILEDFRTGLASGVNGTPTFYVNGRRMDAGGADELFARMPTRVR
jgi:2-hydroxychromene-2-carboxylate isomerase